MTVKELIHLMNTPEDLNAQTLPELKQLLEEYPYFQTARLLYIKNLRKEKDFSFPAQVRKAALYANDRKKLFFLFEGEIYQPLQNAITANLRQTNYIDPFVMIDLFLSEKVNPGENANMEKNMKELATEDYISLLEKDIPVEEKDTPLKHQETIDKFLEEENKSGIRITLTDSTHSSDIPPVETKGKEDFFGETLAKIYIKQGKYEKALKIIRNLMLQYPEKSAYFADQIEDLEKKITNDKKI